MSRHAAISRGPRLGRAPCAPGVLPPRRQPYPASRRRRAVTTRAATQRLTAFPGSTPRQPMHTTTQNRRTPPSSPPHPASADATAHPPPPLPDWQPPSQRFSCKRRIGRARPCARACGTFAASPQTAFAFVTIVENCVPIAQHPCQRTDHASPARPHCRKTPGSGRPPFTHGATGTGGRNERHRPREHAGGGDHKSARSTPPSGGITGGETASHQPSYLILTIIFI